jgi:hypothetical protein
MDYMGVSRSNLTRLGPTEEEEEEARRAYAARVGRKKKRGPWSSALAADKNLAQWERQYKGQLDKRQGTGGRISPRHETNITVRPSDTDLSIKPGSKRDKWALTPSGGSGIRQTLQGDPSAFTGGAYMAHLQNMQNMAAFPGQVRGGGMPRRQERHEEEWAAFDQNVAARRRDLGQMANWQTMQALPPELRLAYFQWMREQENDRNLPDPNMVGIG